MVQPWGHVRSHTKFYWIKTNKQTDRQAKYKNCFFRFESDSMSMLVNEGETVRLPCMVDRLEGKNNNNN